MLCFAPVGHAAELFATVAETTTFDSNVYSDASEEWDMIIEPSGSLAVDFGDIYSIGYNGLLEVFPRHRDLLFHTHELFFFANPTFGEEDQNEIVTELSVKTHRNDDAYAAVNLVEPMLFLEAGFSPTAWFSWTLSETVSFRWFYDDTEADGIDSWTKGELSFTAPSRTTLKPRLIYGLRYYPQLTGPAASDPLDQQLEVGIRIGQNLVEGAGLRLDYAYVHGFDTSATVVRNIDEAAFQYLGEAFLLTAHLLEAGVKFIFDNGISINTAIAFADKLYNGWPARDEIGDPIGKARHDRELGPAARLTYTYLPREDASAAVPELEVYVGYDYQRNWSNDTWYDTDRHRASLGFELVW